ncbi:DNA-binding protein [Gilliamella sp. ESL0441]|uniref:DNA-binding protein n=1 Tax=Gilliamella sp. ESL0441 TaxID=2704654 RepID=UPI001C6A3823|nr:DNA-binding protein [Gilliamella sp. ESL0441]QYN44479.1 DNA-binding protein [Gilliamella sp. ESL0441]
MSKVLTPQQVKQQFQQEGKTIKSWAIENGYHPVVVYNVLNGLSRAHRGKTHDIAVKLRLKQAY